MIKISELEKNFFHPTVKPPTINAQDAEQMQKGLAQLALQIIELIRELMERQVVKKMDSLSIEKQEEMGLHLELLKNKMIEMRDFFGFTDEELKFGLLKGIDDIVKESLGNISAQIDKESLENNPN